MSEASRAGWHAQHLRHGDAQAGQPASSNTRGDRRRLLKEAMRALDESDTERQAARNPSIVAADTHLNRAYVNDGEGGLRELTADEGVEPVLEYGDGRIDSVRRKWHPRAFETTTIVSWVPKSLLKEVPDYYPVYDKSGTEIGRRSRWVMPDDEAGKAEVDRWFAETHKHLTEDVLTGGHDSVHGVVWNYDESVPHVHWMCDTLAPVQKDLSVGEHGIMLDRSGNEVVKYKKAVTVGDVVDVTQDLDGTWRVTSAPEIEVAQIAGIDRHGYLVGPNGERLAASTGGPVRASQDLKVEAQQMWGQSSAVTEARMVDGVEKQVKITGATKMSRYQEQYREHLITQGFDIELEVNPEGTSLDKAAFGASEAEKMAVSAEAEKVAAERAELDRRAEYIAEQMERLDAREEALDVRAAEIDGKEAEARQQAETIVVEARTKAAAIEAEAKKREESGYSAGYQAGSAEGRAEGRVDGRKERLAEMEPEVEAAKADRADAAQSLARQQRAEADLAERLEREEAEKRAEADRRVADYEAEQKAKVPAYDPKAAEEYAPAELIRNVKSLNSDGTRRSGPDDPKEPLITRLHEMGVANHKKDKTGVAQGQFMTETSRQRGERVREATAKLAGQSEAQSKQKQAGYGRGR